MTHHDQLSYQIWQLSSQRNYIHKVMWDEWTNRRMDKLENYMPPYNHMQALKTCITVNYVTINMHTQKKRIFPLFRNALLSFVKFYMHRYFFVLKNTLLCESKTWFIGVVAKIIKLDNKFQPTKTLIFSIFGASCFGKW